MIYSQLRRVHRISRSTWKWSRVSPCLTHHISSETKQPLYEQRFRIVLPFHSPGLAPVIDHHGQAYHINDQGEAAYRSRFKRTFGFYEERAAVQSDSSDHWYHITPNGSSAYASVWQWCGNFQSYRCPVRDVLGDYYHIDMEGSRISGPHSYAGDFREGSAVVRSRSDGLFRAIDEDGRLLHRSTAKSAFLDLDVYHKGFARARDENGWFFINREGDDMGQGRRYRQIENFYNGQALVQLLADGSRCVINEEHQILTRLDSCDRENRADLEQISKAYWQSFALKLGLDQQTSLLASTKDEDPLREHLRRVWMDFGLLSFDPKEPKYQMTDKGRLVFHPESITRDRLQFWLQDRYLSAWLGQEKRSDRDYFADIADQPELVALTQRVLNSYATEDWQGITQALPDDLLHARVIVDLGGGMGYLLKELAKVSSSNNQRLICLDRPEVIVMNQSSSNIQFQIGDLFSGPLPSANYYLLSRVLHDWPDDKAQQILSRIPSESLCIIEREADPTTHSHSLLSLHMHLVHQANERTRDQWNHLFAATGWVVQSRKPFSGHTVMILKRETPIVPPARTGSSSSVRRVVLPIAGLGTRMRPQSLVLPKVLLPILENHDADQWICRPAWNLLLEEIFAPGTGIEEVICIISPDQWQRFHSYLSSSTQHKIKFVIQSEPKGFGHAVLLAEPYLHNEPFIVMLGDHLYKSHLKQSSCLQQLLNAYRQQWPHSAEIGLTGVMTCTEEEIYQTGLLQSKNDCSNGQCFDITDMAEKPPISVAHARFRSVQNPAQYLCQAGIDILPPTIFSQLREDEKIQTPSSELGLRSAMNRLREGGQLRGCLLDGQRYDLGHPKDYYRTLNAFAHASTFKPVEDSPSMHQTVWHQLQNSDEFRQFFSGSSAAIFSASAPGRLDVMGGFADYSGSHVLQYPIAQRTYAFVQRSTSETVRMMSIPKESFHTDAPSITWTREIPTTLLRALSPSTLRERLDHWYSQSMVVGEPPNWPSYIMGVTGYLLQRANLIDTFSGLKVLIVSDVPCNKGLASSAALEVSLARAVSACFDLDAMIPLTELALLCQKVENEVVGSPCGFMDQMTCAHARADHLFSLLCQRVPHPPFTHLSFPSNLELFAIDSGVKRSTASTAYQRVRQAAFLGKQLMNLPQEIEHLCQVPLSTFNQKYRSALPDGDEEYSIRAATSHPIEENFRAQLFEKLLTHNADCLGELMHQSDVGYRSCNLHHEETALLIDLIRQQSSSTNLLLGAKVTGGGGGGTVAVLTRRSPQAHHRLQEIANQYETLTRRRTRFFSGSSPGLHIYSKILFDRY